MYNLLAETITRELFNEIKDHRHVLHSILPMRDPNSLRSRNPYKYLIPITKQHDLEELLFHTVFLGATDSDNYYLQRTLVHFCICICYNVFAYVIVKRLFIVCLFCNMTCYASSMSACFCLYLCCFFSSRMYISTMWLPFM